MFLADYNHTSFALPALRSLGRGIQAGRLRIAIRLVSFPLLRTLGLAPEMPLGNGATMTSDSQLMVCQPFSP